VERSSRVRKKALGHRVKEKRIALAPESSGHSTDDVATLRKPQCAKMIIQTHNYLHLWGSERG